MSILFSEIAQVANGKGLTVVSNPEAKILNVWAYDLPERLSSNYLYIMKATEFEKYSLLENVNVLILADVHLPDFIFQVPGLNVVAIASTEVFTEVCTRVQKLVLDSLKLDDFSKNLLEMGNKSKNVQDVLDFAYHFFNNPLLLVDCTLLVKATSGTYGDMTDPVLKYVQQEGAMPKEYLEAMMLNSGVQDEEIENLVILESNIKNYEDTSIIASHLVNNDRLLGYIKLVEYHHKATTLDKKALLILSKCLALMVSSSSYHMKESNPAVEEFVLNLINQRTTSPASIAMQSSVFRLNSSIPLYVLAVGHQLKRLSEDQQFYFKRQIMALSDRATVVLVPNQLVVVLPMEEYEKKQFITKFQVFVENNQLIVGVGLPFSGYDRLYKHYQQAVSAIGLRNQLSIADPIVYYDDVKLNHMILSFDEHCNLEVLIPDYIRVLERTDAANGTRLVQTLFAYVRHRFSVTETAEELFLHYNTLKYRLNQIANISGIDYNDPNTILEICISERVMKLMKEM